MINFILGVIVGGIFGLITFALCYSSGRCPYQHDDGSCILHRDTEEAGV